jgi:hypothetical protein
MKHRRSADEQIETAIARMERKRAILRDAVAQTMAECVKDPELRAAMRAVALVGEMLDRAIQTGLLESYDD